MLAGMVSPDVSLLPDGQLSFALEMGSHYGWSRTLDDPLVFAASTWIALGSLLCAPRPGRLMKSLDVLPTSRQHCGTGIFKITHTLAVFHFPSPTHMKRDMLYAFESSDVCWHVPVVLGSDLGTGHGSRNQGYWKNHKNMCFDDVVNSLVCKEIQMM